MTSSWADKHYCGSVGPILCKTHFTLMFSHDHLCFFRARSTFRNCVQSNTQLWKLALYNVTEGTDASPMSV